MNRDEKNEKKGIAVAEPKDKKGKEKGIGDIGSLLGFGGNDKGNGDDNNNDDNRKKMLVRLVVVSLLIFIMVTAFKSVYEDAYPDIHMIDEITYTEFEELLDDGDVYKIEYSSKCEYMKVILYNDKTRELDREDLKRYNFSVKDYRKVLYPGYDNFRLEMLRHNVELEIKSTNGTVKQGLSVLTDMGSLLFVIFWVVLLFSVIKTFQTMPKTFGNNIETKQKTDKKLSDVIGHNEIMDDLKLIINMVKKPEMGKKLGAEIPKGILFVGEPGTGKTLIAKALAGEANVPFLYMNASNFVELYVGMGARRVRELFKEAKKCAPCIVFIDEIDAVGASRFNRMESNSERQQTVNALLQEMDGFKDNKGVLVIAATNNADILDKALTRAGRFDRTIVIAPPEDWRVRKQLFEHFTEKMLLNADVDLEKLARQSGGFTGADIQVVCNEAALIAIGRNQEDVTMDNFEEGIDKKILKGNRSMREQKQAEKDLTMYHEAGHAVISYLLKKLISRVTVVGTTSGVGGFVLHEEAEETYRTKADFEHDIMISYAGRASEEIKFGKDNISIGASSDITQATKLLKVYVMQVGFDKEMGLLDLNVVQYDEERVFARMKEIANKLYAETLDLLSRNYGYVEKLVGALREKETLSGNEVYELFEGTDEDAQNNRNINEAEE